MRELSIVFISVVLLASCTFHWVEDLRTPEQATATVEIRNSLLPTVTPTPQNYPVPTIESKIFPPSKVSD